MSILPRPFRFILPAAVAVLTLTAGARGLLAQTTIAQTYDIGLKHAEAKPYNFTGRVFDNVNVGFGSGTLIRRHTVLTAAHVIYDPTTGFSTGLTFTRALYENYDLSKAQVAATDVLSGYQAAATTNDTETIASGSRDLGYCLLDTAPVDEDWANFEANETLLTTNAIELFVLGYPGVSFDGRTMAYTVPNSPFVEVGVGDTGYFENDTINFEAGNSGGPVFAYVGPVYPAGKAVPYVSTNYQVVGEVLAGLDDPTGEFNSDFVRGITSEAVKFLQAAEYTSGLISNVKIKGPKTVASGSTVTYNLKIIFAVPDAITGATDTTNRYPELRLNSNTPGTPTNPVVVINKLSNTQFSVNFGSQLRSGSTVMLTALYAKGQEIPTSTVSVTIE